MLTQQNAEEVQGKVGREVVVFCVCFFPFVFLSFFPWPKTILCLLGVVKLVV